MEFQSSHYANSTLLNLNSVFTALQVTSICFAIILLVIYSHILFKSKVSLLGILSGPWYALNTALHSQYFFAQGTIWTYARQQYQKYGSIVRLGPRQARVSDKTAMKDILLTTDLAEPSTYSKTSRDRNIPASFGDMYVLYPPAEGSESYLTDADSRPIPHETLKRFLGPAFTVSSVDKLDQIFMKYVSTLLRSYYEQSSKSRAADFETDLMRDVHCLALDIIGQNAFGKRFGQTDQVFDPSKIITSRDQQWPRIPSAIFSGLVKRYRFLFMRQFLRRCGIALNFDWLKKMAMLSLIDERKSDNTVNNQYQTESIGVLQHMIDGGDRPDIGVRMNNRNDIDQMSELLLAGSETTSGTIGCLFLELCRNPDVKRKLLASLPILGPADPMLDSKTVRRSSRFEYLEACIRENLRMHPIASDIGRHTLEKSHIHAGREIPPCIVVSAPHCQLHLDEDHWPHAKRFWPERWLRGEKRGEAPAPDLDAYYPFSAGKHSCMGQNFAYAEIRTISANLLSRFDIKEISSKTIKFRQFVTVQFHDGSWKVKLTPRANTLRNIN